jgi:TolA-binding protein
MARIRSKTGEARFEQKNWREAIFAYEDYRKDLSQREERSVRPPTRSVSAFQELGMNEDAKPFYEEVIAKFPKSKEADRARARLKTLNKKR